MIHEFKPKLHAFGGKAGCMETKKRRSTGSEVSIYRCEQAGLDATDGAWATVCETHSSICNHRNKVKAIIHAAAPEGWCEACARIHDALEEKRRSV